MLQVAILAGGLATRMKPITEKIPKSLLDVSGKPFIVRQLEYLKIQGVSKVVLCVGHLEHMIKDVVGDGAQFGLDICYSSDGSKSLGTGGALKKAIPYLDEAFFVLYGDSFLPVLFRPIMDVFNIKQKPAMLTVLRNENKWDKSNVHFENGELIEYNKIEPHSDMKYIDYGLSVMARQTIETFHAGDMFDLAQIYHELSNTKNLAGYEVYERFYEIGSYSGLEETCEFFRRGGK